MDIYDLSHKLAYAGSRCPVPFTTGPEYINSVLAVPVLSTVRIFVEPENWSVENVLTIAREIARILGPTEQYDIGMTLSDTVYDPGRTAAGNTARLMKPDAGDPRIVLRVSDGQGDAVFQARYPRLRFEPLGEDFWRSAYAPGAVKVPAQQ